MSATTFFCAFLAAFIPHHTFASETTLATNTLQCVDGQECSQSPAFVQKQQVYVAKASGLDQEKEKETIENNPIEKAVADNRDVLMVQHRGTTATSIMTSDDCHDFVQWSFENLTWSNIHSNLGGLGPHTEWIGSLEGNKKKRKKKIYHRNIPLTNPEEMRFSRVVKEKGVDVDLVVTSKTKYVPNPAAVKDNGLASGFGNINVACAPGSTNSVELEFNFYESGTYTPFNLDKFYFTIYDVDEDKGDDKAVESVTFYDIDEEFKAANSELHESGFPTWESGLTFTATKFGNSKDNPNDPESLTPDQESRAVGVSFSDKSSWRTKFSVTNGSSGRGRNFYFAGHSSIIQCIERPHIERCISGEDPEQATYTFDPDSEKLLGIELDADSSKVTQILDDSQAKDEDMNLNTAEYTLVKVETLKYSQERLARARNGNAEYTLTFEVCAKPTPAPTPCSDDDYLQWSFKGYKHKNIHSNLGGQGPDGGNQELRFSKIATTKEEVGLDLVVTTTTNYEVYTNENNGKKGEFGALNLKSDSSVTLQFGFYETGTTTPVDVNKFYFTIYDVDEDVDRNRRTSESITFYDIDEDDVFTVPNPELTRSGDSKSESGLTFTSQGFGTSDDNPTSPEELTEGQKRRAVTVSFSNTSSWKVKIAVEGGSRGRNFFFAGHASTVPECATIP